MGVLARLTHRISRRGKPLLRLAHIEIRLAEIQINGLLRLFQRQQGNVTLRLCRLNRRACNAAVKDVPTDPNGGGHIRVRIMTRLKLTREPRAERETDGGFLPCPCAFDSKLFLLHLHPFLCKIETAAVRI